MSKIISLGLLITFPLIYFDFGHDGGGFIGLTEFELLRNFTNLSNPLLLIVLIGQIAVILGISTKNIKFNNLLTGIGAIIFNIIAIPIFFLGMITNFKVILSGIPFLIMTFAFIYRYIRDNDAKNNSKF